MDETQEEGKKKKKPIVVLEIFSIIMKYSLKIRRF